MIRKVLGCTDASPAATMAVEQAADLARAYGAELLLLHVTPDEVASEIYPPTPAVDLDRYFGSLVESFPDLGVQTRQETGDPGKSICSVAEDEAVDVIVLGNRGTHASHRWYLGSVPNAVLKNAPCSVLVVDTRSKQ